MPVPAGDKVALGFFQRPAKATRLDRVKIVNTLFHKNLLLRREKVTKLGIN